MDVESATILRDAALAHGEIMSVLAEWTDLLEGNEQAEARHHVIQISHAFYQLTTAMADYQGVMNGPAPAEVTD